MGAFYRQDSSSCTVLRERLEEIKCLIEAWLNFEAATVKQLQSLIGKLNFVAHCVKPSRIFISRLLNWLRDIQNSETQELIQIKKDLK